MYQTHREILDELNHKFEFRHRLRANLQKLELQLADYGIAPPLILINEADRHREKISLIENEILQLQALEKEFLNRSVENASTPASQHENTYRIPRIIQITVPRWW